MLLDTLSSESGTYKTVQDRFWPWLPGESPLSVSSGSLMAWNRRARYAPGNLIIQPFNLSTSAAGYQPLLIGVRATAVLIKGCGYQHTGSGFSSGIGTWPLHLNPRSKPQRSSAAAPSRHAPCGSAAAGAAARPRAPLLPPPPPPHLNSSRSPRGITTWS
jgi:hypothetical protein